jgi:hypothetical protein
MASMSRNPDLRPQTMESLEYQLNKCLSGRGQAVASILGMTTDANVVATLNPGISTRNLDSGIVHAASTRAGTGHGGMEVWDTRSGVSRGMYNSGPNHMAHPTPSGPVRAPSEPGLTMPPAASGQMRAASPNQFARAGTPAPTKMSSSPTSAPIVSEILSSPGPLPELKRSGAGTLGWILLILILLGGGGALAYMMLYKKEPTTTAPDPKDPTPDDNEIKEQPVETPHETPKETPKKKNEKNDKSEKNEKNEKSEKLEKAEKVEKAETKTEPKSTAETPPKKTTSKTVAALDDKSMTWRQISDAAKKAEAAGDWETALYAYQKLEKAKGYQYPGWAVYKQAWSAFQMNDTQNAVSLAQRASTMPGNQKPDAKLLYADALFKQGDFKRAKDFYIGLRKQFTGEAKKLATVNKKIAACNKALKLPESDGIK